MKSTLYVDERGRHAAMTGARTEGAKSEITEGVTSFKEKMQLHDDRVLDIVFEPWWQGLTATLLTIFPSVIIQQQVNSLSTRHIVPRGPDAFDFVWTHFGFADDTPEMKRRRLRQANLFGPAGYVSADDGEVIEFSQRGFRQHEGLATVVELDGRGTGGADHTVTETLIRSMYRYYREVMEV
jgi:salicylate 5-hydroxylase large subunit